MSQTVKVCDIDSEVLAKLQKFRFRKETTCAAIILKIDPEKLLIVIDEEHEDITVEDVAEELPAHLPRYVAYSYVHHHDDGRISYPLCFIYISPQGCKPELQMMYAGSKLHLVQAGGFTKVFEIRSVEELTEEWLKNKLGFFR